MPVAPWQHNALIRATCQADAPRWRWEAWRQLYNAGFRGEDLNGWLR